MALRIPRLAWWQWLVLAVAGLAVAWLLWSVARMVDWPALLTELKKRPLLYFSALAVLPAFGAPVAPFYVGAGAATGGANPAFPLWVALAASLAAMTVNITLSYVLARWIVHPVIERLARKLGYTIPQVPREHRWIATVLIRITPGPPFFMQHYLLALGRVPFGVYMAVSIPICGLMASGAVAAGAGLTSGNAGGLVAGLCFLVAIVLGVRFARRALQRKSHMKVGAHGEVETDTADRPAAAGDRG